MVVLDCHWSLIETAVIVSPTCKKGFCRLLLNGVSCVFHLANEMLATLWLQLLVLTVLLMMILVLLFLSVQLYITMQWHWMGWNNDNWLSRFDVMGLVATLASNVLIYSSITNDQSADFWRKRCAHLWMTSNLKLPSHFVLICNFGSF